MPFPEETLGQSSDYDDHVENYGLFHQGLFHRTTIDHRLLQLYKRYWENKLNRKPSLMKILSTNNLW